MLFSEDYPSLRKAGVAQPSSLPVCRQNKSSSSATYLSLLCCSLTLISIWPLEKNRSSKKTFALLSKNGQSQMREVGHSQLQGVKFGKPSVLTFLFKNTEKLSLSHTKLKFPNFIIKSTIVNQQNAFCGLNFLNDTW